MPGIEMRSASPLGPRGRRWTLGWPRVPGCAVPELGEAPGGPAWQGGHLFRPHPGRCVPTVCRTAETQPLRSPFLCLDLTYVSSLLQELGFPGDKVLKVETPLAPRPPILHEHLPALHTHLCPSVPSVSSSWPGRSTTWRPVGPWGPLFITSTP